MRQVYVPALLLALAGSIGSAEAGTIQVFFDDFDGSQTVAPGVSGGFVAPPVLTASPGGGQALAVPPAGGAEGSAPQLSLSNPPAHSGIRATFTPTTPMCPHEK